MTSTQGDTLIGKVDTMANNMVTIGSYIQISIFILIWLVIAMLAIHGVKLVVGLFK